ncbi:MAG: endolytic transglycosylase MltG [Parcubacteria group bacterium]|nr:endolytic transglycosylase MltG [Parcubacteria group bacterium]
MKKLFLLSLLPILAVLFLIAAFFALSFVISFLRNKANQEFKFTPNDIAITFPEGFTKNEIKKRFEENGFFVSLELDKNTSGNLRKKFDFFIGAPSGVINLEGFLFPDTYRFDKNSSEEEIISRMLNNFDKKLDLEFREEIKNQNKSVFEIVTMASLIEEEGKIKTDREIISGILWKRLEVGMPLQIDATINYITNGKNLKIPLEETKIKSPYNTYLNKGLPLGPIASPGLESIEAAVFPEKTEFWYYLSKPTGEIIFSKTLEEHNIAKVKYLK